MSFGTEKTKQLEILCHLFKLGYNLIPCNGKKPCVKWKQYQTARIPGACYKPWAGGRFDEWQLYGGIVNWALLVGSKPYSSAPALICIDCDDAEAITLAQDRCPPTPAMQTTPRGGKHFIYRRPDVEYIGQTLGLRYNGRNWKMDIKADGNYIMAPGSIKDDGTIYQWSEPWTLEMLQAAPVFDPSWLPSEQQRTTSKTYSSLDDHDELTENYDVPIGLRKERAEHFLSKCPGSEKGNGADSYCFALAMKLLWGFVLPADIAHELLYRWGQKETNVKRFGVWYPWSEKEIHHKIDNALHTEYQNNVGDSFDPTAYLEQLFEELYGQEKETCNR